MRIFISIDGVLRNLVQKFNYHYIDAYINSELEESNTFEYGVNEPITNNLFESFKFQSIDEFNDFLYFEYPLEIFGHAGLSSSTAISDLNKLINLNKDHEFIVVGFNEFGKARSATLFFLSKNGFLGEHIKFINEDNIIDAWNECDCWITDNQKIIELRPRGNKLVYKFNTSYNQYFTIDNEITKLIEIQEPWLTFLENNTTSTSTLLLKPADSHQEVTK